MDKVPDRILEFTVLNFIPGWANPPVERGTGRLIDVTESGLRFLTDASLRPGDLLALTAPEITRTGIVMWTLQDNSRWNVGVRFLAPS